MRFFSLIVLSSLNRGSSFCLFSWFWDIRNNGRTFISLERIGSICYRGVRGLGGLSKFRLRTDSFTEYIVIHSFYAIPTSPDTRGMRFVDAGVKFSLPYHARGRAFDFCFSNCIA